MAIKKFITGNFYDEKVLFPAVTKVRKAGYKLMMFIRRFQFMD